MHVVAKEFDLFVAHLQGGEIRQMSPVVGSVACDVSYLVELFVGYVECCRAHGP